MGTQVVTQTTQEITKSSARARQLHLQASAYLVMVTGPARQVLAVSCAWHPEEAGHQLPQLGVNELKSLPSLPLATTNMVLQLQDSPGRCQRGRVPGRHQ